MRARGAAKKVAVRRDDENAAPTIEGDDADRNETSKVMPRRLTVHIRPSFRTVRPRTCLPTPPAHVPPGPTPKDACVSCDAREPRAVPGVPGSHPDIPLGGRQN